MLNISCKTQTDLGGRVYFLLKSSFTPNTSKPSHSKRKQLSDLGGGRGGGNKRGRENKTGQPCCLFALGVTNPIVTQHKSTGAMNELTGVTPYLLIRNKHSGSVYKAREGRYLLLPLTLPHQKRTQSSDSRRGGDLQLSPPPGRETFPAPRGRPVSGAGTPRERERAAQPGGWRGTVLPGGVLPARKGPNF